LVLIQREIFVGPLTNTYWIPILTSKKTKRKLKPQHSIFSRRFTCGRGNTKCAVALPRMLLHTFGIGFRRITLILLGFFYLTVKIHKGPLSTRPVCSDCASLVHPFGKWLNYTLQPVVACQPFYFKDLFLLKQKIDKLVLPPNASIITFDAIMMYTNIVINNSIKKIMKFISEIWDKYDCKAVEEAMNIIMQNNHMRFGDLFF
jgi:hypothetical protein